MFGRYLKAAKNVITGIKFVFMVSVVKIIKHFSNANKLYAAFNIIIRSIQFVFFCINLSINMKGIILREILLNNFDIH